MKRDYLIGFAVSVAVLALLAFAAWSLFEVYPRPRYIPPSREARANEYLALDRWLTEQGIGVKVESRGDLDRFSMIVEKKAFIQASLFRWTIDAANYLIHWVEKGGTLFLALDTYYAMEDDGILFLLNEFGITAVANYPSYYDDTDLYPDYDRRFYFEISDDADALPLRDSGGAIKLLQMIRGKGKFIVSGDPHFLKSPSIGSAPNARLAWGLFADTVQDIDSINDSLFIETQQDSNWLFIRGTPMQRGLIGELFTQGALPVLIVSLLALIAIGFWAALPAFGLVRGDIELPGKPLRERFLAEALFLKKYGSLKFYLEAYLKEIKRKFALAGVSGDDFQKRITELGIETSLISGLLQGKPMVYKDFTRLQKNLKEILEKI